MRYIHAESSDKGVAEMAERIIEALDAGRKVLWLVCGGSNIPMSARAMSLMKKKLEPGRLSGLTIGQTDERYGPVGHSDSNWQQMIDDGFDFDGANRLPILSGRSLDETVADYDKKIGKAMSEALAAGDLVIAQFGMGADGHIAGMLPHSPAVEDEHLVCGYESMPFTRVTLTPKALLKIQMAYAFVFGRAKSKAVSDLRDKDLPLADEPAQILKQIPEAVLWSDLV